MPSQKKIQIVASLSDSLSKSDNFVIIDFGSATHQAMEGVRKALMENAARLKVIKNSLLKVALAKMGQNDLVDAGVAGKTAVMTLPSDWSETLSSFFKLARDNEAFSFKIGLLDGAIYDKSGLEKLALLPSRSQLVIKIITSLRTPQTRLVYAMNYSTVKFINVLKQKAG